MSRDPADRLVRRPEGTRRHRGCRHARTDDGRIEGSADGDYANGADPDDGVVRAGPTTIDADAIGNDRPAR